MFVHQHDNSALIRWALTYAMEEKTGVRVDWDCVTLFANGNHLAFSEVDDCRHRDKADAIMQTTVEIWRELHPRTVD